MWRKDLNKTFLPLFLVSLGILFSLSCKKREIVEFPIPEPIFSFHGTINGDSLVLIAGIDGIEAIPNVFLESSQQFKSFGGHLGNNGYFPRKNGVGIVFNDSSLRTSLGSSEIGPFLMEPNKKFLLDTLQKKEQYADVQLFAEPSPPGLSYSYRWFFEDGTISYFPSLTYRFANNTTQKVVLVTESDGNTDTIVNYITTTDTSLLCPLQFKAYSTITGFNLEADPGYSNYQWEFSDGTQLSGRSIDWVPSGPGRFKIKCSATGPSGCLVSFNKTLVYPNTSNIVSANFSYRLIQSRNLDVLRDNLKNKIKISCYTNGTSYSSKISRHHINPANYLRVNKVEPFRNYSNSDCVKVELEFAAWLYNITNRNDSIFVESKKVIIPIGYPKSN
jgi:hypothetical protein